MEIYLLNNFNNYFNRKVIKLSSLQDYLEAVGEDNYFRIPDTNFKPNDGVSTTHIIGSGTRPFNKNWQPDYCLVVEWLDGGKPRIVSRWFVIDAPRTMKNQYTVTLKRDSVVDYFNQTFSAPCFIKKGNLMTNDPFIINNEGIEFNQIKTKELYLKDESKVPWAIVYLARERTKDWTVTAKYFPAVDGYYDDPNDPNYNELQTLYNYLQNKTSPTTYNYLQKNNIIYEGDASYFYASYLSVISGKFPFEGYVETQATYLGLDQQANPDTNSFLFISEGQTKSTDELKNDIRSMSNSVISRLRNNFYSIMQPFMQALNLKNNETGVDISDTIMNKWNNKIIGSKQTGRIYRVYFSKGSIESSMMDSNAGSVIYNQFNQIKLPNWTVQNKNLTIYYTKIFRTYQLSEVISTDISLTIPKNTYQTQESTFDILAFPLFNTRMVNGNQIYNCAGSAALNIASAIKTQLGDFCYDVQILPYAPFQSLIDAQTHEIDLARAYSSQSIQVKRTDNQAVVSIGIIAPYAHFTFDITKLGTSIYSDEEVSVASETTITNRKVQSNTDMWRLSSPNYASQFEFNIAKMININGGTSISKFNIDCTYRPFNPYIKVNPDFSFLYGQDFNDARGLICSGDFGITTMSDAWVNFQIQNKNYQNAFDRQIASLETNRAIAREQESWNVVKASIGTGLGVAGGMLGGIIGDVVLGSPVAALGAGLGGIAAGISGGLNIASAKKQQGWNERAYQEQRAFTTDMFNMQMDNIKALPQAITHTSSVSYNFKFYPVLEYYTCTDEEKRSLELKIRYNGMTVGRLGEIKSYVSFDGEAFLQGEIIRLENINDDSHIAQDIYNEVNKGLFIEQQPISLYFTNKASDTTISTSSDIVEIIDETTISFKKSSNLEIVITFTGNIPSNVILNNCTATYSSGILTITGIDAEVGTATIELVYTERGGKKK